ALDGFERTHAAVVRGQHERHDLRSTVIEGVEQERRLEVGGRDVGEPRAHAPEVAAERLGDDPVVGSVFQTVVGELPSAGTRSRRATVTSLHGPRAQAWRFARRGTRTAAWAAPRWPGSRRPHRDRAGRRTTEA